MARARVMLHMPCTPSLNRSHWASNELKVTGPLVACTEAPLVVLMVVMNGTRSACKPLGSVSSGTCVAVPDGNR
jgi:hypothetical protein